MHRSQAKLQSEIVHIDVCQKNQWALMTSFLFNWFNNLLEYLPIYVTVEQYFLSEIFFLKF